MKKPERIIVFGGSFDPPHAGHLRLARAALNFLRPARLIVLPAFRSPLKSGHGAPYAGRRAMLAALFHGLKGVEISDLEKRRGRVTYTWQALEYFRKKNPGAELYFLMGSDCLPDFRRWKKHERILKEATLLVGLRPGSYGAPAGVAYRPLPGIFPDVASSELRTALYAGYAGQYLPPAVLKVIEARGLYLAALRRKVKKLVSPRRFRHVLASSWLAAELAAAHGLDPLKAAQAALIHDAAREWPPGKLARWARKSRPAFPYFKETLANGPHLFHGAAAAALAPRLFGIKDPVVLRAASLHTTGSDDMTLFDKLVYLADAASPDRGFPEATRVRLAAFRDLDRAFILANGIKLKYICKSKMWLHPMPGKIWKSRIK